jgi:hypothetical protein
MKWLLIFGVLIGVVLLCLQQSMFFLSGISPTFITPFLLLLSLAITVILLIRAIKLYKSRDLKGQITTLQGFGFVLTTFSLGFILFMLYTSYSFSIKLQNVPRRYYSVDVNPNLVDLEVNWVSLFISYISESGYAFLFMAIISFIIAKIFSRSTPSV